MIFEQRWTSVSPEQYAQESTLVGDPDNLSTVERSTSERSQPRIRVGGQTCSTCSNASRAEERTSRCGGECGDVALTAARWLITFVPRVGAPG